jgi:hypothetical protein
VLLPFFTCLELSLQGGSVFHGEKEPWFPSSFSFEALGKVLTCTPRDFIEKSAQAYRHVLYECPAFRNSFSKYSSTIFKAYRFHENNQKHGGFCLFLSDFVENPLKKTVFPEKTANFPRICYFTGCIFPKSDLNLCCP